MTNFSELLEALKAKHSYLRRETSNYPLHPSITKLLKSMQPTDLTRLILEWPHVAQTDPTRLAFTRNPDHGEADRQTLTSLGKYLRSIFASEDLPDHKIRDVVALASTEGCMGFTHDIREMVNIVQNGPGSCMKDSSWDFECHPYRVYAPEYGWHLAFRLGEGGYDGRALCLTFNDTNIYVRSYKRGDGYSYSDEALEAWLEDQGYEKRGAWPEGARMALIEFSNDCGFLAPYMDGERQCVGRGSNHLVISEDGDYTFACTDGDADCNSHEECTYCGDTVDMEDDFSEHVYAGRYEDSLICGYCAHRHFSLVIGVRGSQYYQNDDYVVNTVEGQSYDEDYLDDNNIVSLEDGDYTHIDNAVCTLDGEWYHVNDVGDYIIYLEVGIHQGEYVHHGNTWECAVSSNIYHDDDPYVIGPDGERIHINYWVEEEDAVTTTEPEKVSA